MFFFTCQHFFLFRPRVIPRAPGSVAHREPARTQYPCLGPGRGPWHVLWGLKEPRSLGEEIQARRTIQAHAKPTRMRYSSCRYNDRQLIDVTVVRRVRPRAERWCDCEGHRRWCPLYVCSFFFCNTPPTCNHHHCIDTPPLHRKGGGRRTVGYRKAA